MSVYLRWPLLVMLALLSTKGIGFAESEPLAISVGGEDPTRLALIVGIGDFQNFPPLYGTVNDARDIRELLTSPAFGFPEKNVLSLHGIEEKPIRKQDIIDAFRDHLIEKAKVNSTVVIYISSHGSQAKDYSGDEGGSDDWDETIVTWESGRKADSPFDLRDDELNSLLRELTAITKNVTVVLDLCHSGSGTRGLPAPKDGDRDSIDTDSRYSIRDSRKAPEGDESPPRDVFGVDMDAEGIVVISACRPEETAYEMFHPELVDQRTKEYIKRGRLTYYLCKAIREAVEEKESITYEDVFLKIRDQINVGQPPSKWQHPQIEGKNMDRLVFGTRTLKIPAHVQGHWDGKEFILRQGVSLGVVAGTKFEIFPLTDKEFVEGQGMGMLEVIEAGANRSRCELLPGPSPKEVGPFRAAERFRPFSSDTFSVFVADNNIHRELVEKVKREVEVGGLYLSKDPRHASLHISIQDDGFIFVDEAGVIIKPLPIDKIKPSVTIRHELLPRMKRRAQWWDTFSRRNNSSVNVKVSLELIRHEDGALLENVEVPDGGKIRIRITNHGTEKFYFGLINLQGDGGRVVLYPKNGKNDTLDPGKSWPAEAKARLEMSVAREYEKFGMRDTLKVIATTKPVDYRSLALPGFEAKSKGVDDWATAEANVFIFTAESAKRASYAELTGYGTEAEIDAATMERLVKAKEGEEIQIALSSQKGPLTARLVSRKELAADGLLYECSIDSIGAILRLETLGESTTGSITQEGSRVIYKVERMANGKIFLRRQVSDRTDGGGE